jgi:hypothetical protein
MPSPSPNDARSSLTIENACRPQAGRPAENALLLLALGVYVAVRLIRLVDYPTWFFADEAIQTVLASDFVRDGFRDFHGHLFPTYFLNVYGYNENLTVYVQVIPYLLFGKSVFVTRATSVLVTAFGALAVGLILRRVFRLRMPWIGILLLSSAPAWFLHSRTAFETTPWRHYAVPVLPPAYCTGSLRAVFPAAVLPRRPSPPALGDHHRRHRPLLPIDARHTGASGACWCAARRTAAGDPLPALPRRWAPSTPTCCGCSTATGCGTFP